MRSSKRTLLFTHLAIGGAALMFLMFAFLMRHLFPNGYFDCLMGDVLHLYCPFCGGTRALLALVSFDFKQAFFLNSGVMLAALFALVLDARAILLACRGRERDLLPRWTYSVAILYFVAWALLRNAAMLFGLDPAGDHAPYWADLSALRAAFAVIVAVLMCIAFLWALMPSRRERPYKRIALDTGLCLLVTLALLLYARPYLALGYALPIGVIIYQFIHEKEKQHEVSDFFRE